MIKAIKIAKLSAIFLFAIIILSACGTNLPSNNDIESSSSTLPSPTKQVNGEKIIISCEKYGFELEAPKSWEDKIETNQEDDFVVTHKTISKNAAVQNPIIFTIVEYGSREKWDNDSKRQDQPFPYVKLGEIDGKVYAYLLPFDIPYNENSPEDLNEYTYIINEVESVLNTFKITGSGIINEADNKYIVAGIENADAFELYFDTLKQLIAKDDKEAVASNFCYPVSINIDGKKITFNKADELTLQYDKVFTEKVKNAVLKQEIKDLFVNQQGVMVGNGELWLGVQTGEKYYILSVNP